MDEGWARHIEIGHRFLEEGDFSQAVQAFNATLEGNPGSAEALWGRALARERQEELAAALVDCEQALTHKPDHFSAWLTRGSIHARRGERMSAMECFRRALQLEPQRAAAHHLLTTVGGKGFSAPLRAEVEELFERYAERFDQHLVDGLGYQGHVVLPETIKRVTGTSQVSWTVLELGCGTGLCGPGLRRLARRLTGVDLSPTSLAQARRRGVYDVLYVADLVYALACAAPSSIDLVAAADVLSYLGDLEPVFEESVRALRPGGLLAFTVEACESRAEVEFRASRRVAFSESYLRRMALARGLAPEVMETVPLRRESGREMAELVVVFRKLKVEGQFSSR